MLDQVASEPSPIHAHKVVIIPCTVLQVTQLYREHIPEDAVVLDLMSSWVSHLPPEKKYKRVIGHGMNAAEVSFSVPRHTAVSSTWAC